MSDGVNTHCASCGIHLSELEEQGWEPDYEVIADEGFVCPECEAEGG